MATVVFLRDTTNNIANIPIVDGQIILSTDENFIYLDNGNQRIQYRNNGLASGVQYTGQDYSTLGDNVQTVIETINARTKIATDSSVGVIKPDNTTITVTSDGTLSASQQSARVVPYVPSEGMTARNVQDAIDELKTMIMTLSNTLNNNYYTGAQVNTMLNLKLNKNALQLTGTTLNITLDEIVPA